MINITKNTKEIKGRMMSDEMRKIIKACYQHFSKSHVPSTLNLCDCPCCISHEMVKYLLHEPLCSISPIGIWEYINAVSFSSSDESAEMAYFLPRILELIAEKEEVAHSIEIQLNKLKQVVPNLDHKACQLLNDFALQYWKDCLNDVSEFGYSSVSFSEVFIMFAGGGLSVVPLLSYLVTMTEFWIVSNCADFIFGDRENGKLRSAFASDYPELDVEINQWLQNNAEALSQNAQIAVLNMPDLAWQNQTTIDYLRDEYLLAMCDKNIILATLPYG